MVRLSDSFADTIRGVIEDAGFQALDHDRGSALPDDLAGVLVMAGGAESEAIEWLGGQTATAPVFLVGAETDHRVGIGAVAQGARDYFALPGDLDLLRRTVERLAREADPAALEEFTRGERESKGFDAIVGRSAALQTVLEQARRAAAVRDVTVLIGGETGTGKELLAHAIHLASNRAAAPFVEINCAAIPANLLESELFGHEKGAFTGAVASKPGLLEIADGGTLFLDEVATLPLELQPKLLRALEAREIRRVGGQTIRKIDVRVIGASHVDLRQAVADGGFREDLYYRLNVLQLLLPPLRERGEDIERLAETFVARLARQFEMPTPPLDAKARATLRAHDWPGNIRELRNVIERALVLSPPGALVMDDLRSPAPTSGLAGTLPFPAPLSSIIRAAILETLARTNGNKSEAARRLGISRPRLQRILDGDTEG